MRNTNRKIVISKPPRIGCAGWSIGAADAHLFGDGDSLLARYATRFNAVEINSSFHRPHRTETYERWAATVPADFRFSVKLPKTITHEQRLQGAGALLDRFVAETSGLEKKLGGILIQLPPSLPFDARIASRFFTMLRRRTNVPLACEPRHATWFTAAVVSLLEHFDATRVAADPAPFSGAETVVGAGSWRYWRWHGAPRRYYSNYLPAKLDALAYAVRSSTPPRAVPWIIFDNTAAGHATKNALALQLLLAPSLPTDEVVK